MARGERRKLQTRRGGRVPGRISVIPVAGIPEVEPKTNLVQEIIKAMKNAGLELRSGDVVVVKQKVVSKAEGRIVKLDEVVPGPAAAKLAAEQRKDPRLVELILSEAVRVVRAGHGVIVTETKQGLVCANSGVDKSNVREGHVALLPVDPDRSARRIRKRLEEVSGAKVGVVISDTFGRPWRKGQTDVAIGCSGIAPLYSYRGRKDKFGYSLKVTEPSVVDEIASAAELAMGKLSDVPVAVVRGVTFTRGEGGVRSQAIEREKDLFT